MTEYMVKNRGVYGYEIIKKQKYSDLYWSSQSFGVYMTPEQCQSWIKADIDFWKNFGKI